MTAHQPSSPPLSEQEAQSRAYYDEFSLRYEERRAGAVPQGYHELLDQLESEYVRKFGEGKRVLEVGCGTGLVLSRIQEFASEAQGVDLSPGMLEKARARNLHVQEGSATALPFPDHSFDVTCSFKVLAHVPDIDLALCEMARVTRPGGVILAELYNPWSLRGLLRILGPVQRIGSTKRESDVYTRFDSPLRAKKLTPPDTEFIEARGIRIISPAAHLVDHPRIGPWFFRAEKALADTPLKNFAGFYIAAYRKLPLDSSRS